MIYEIDLREKPNDVRPVVLSVGQDCLLYWRMTNGNGSDGTNCYWLKAGWYRGAEAQPKTEKQIDLVNEGRRLRQRWRKTAVHSSRDKVPSWFGPATFWFGGECFRYENFPRGAVDVRRAFTLLERKTSRADVCRRFRLSETSGRHTLKRVCGAIKKEEGESDETNSVDTDRRGAASGLHVDGRAVQADDH